MRAGKFEGNDLEDWVAAARKGDEDAFAKIYKAWQPGLFRFLYAREPREAEDLCSEIWVAMARILPRFEGGSHELRAWMFSVARRQVAGHRRRGLRRKIQAFSLDSGSDTGAPAGFEAISAAGSRVTATSDVEFFVETELAAAGLARKIAKVLPEAQADALLLKVLGGLDAGEIAAIMGKKEATVRQLQHRAVLKLSKVLSREPERSVTK
jgi:RNA polymerase sigma-70 factor (ECF subfamily)